MERVSTTQTSTLATRRQTGLGSAGVAALAAGLRTNATLRTLGLRYLGMRDRVHGGIQDVSG